jgi:hypothetical protein
VVILGAAAAIAVVIDLIAASGLLLRLLFGRELFTFEFAQFLVVNSPG